MPAEIDVCTVRLHKALRGVEDAQRKLRGVEGNPRSSLPHRQMATDYLRKAEREYDSACGARRQAREAL